MTKDGEMKSKFKLLFLLIIMCGSSVFGQLKYTFSQFGDETWDFIKQPTRWEGSDYLKIGVMGFLTYEIMMNYDQPIREDVLKDQRYFKSVPIVFGRMWGELYSPVILFGGFAIHSLLTNDIETRKIAYEIGQASLYAGAINYILKVAIGRARPYTDEGNTSFHPFSTLFNVDHQSMPGGHSTAAFVLSTVLSRNAKPLWLKILAYVPAALTFVSRIYQDQHWTSDDFLGAAFGYFIATWVVDQHENNNSTVGVSSAFPLSIRISLN
jgi:membrane-associated phospholipid phosphatase